MSNENFNAEMKTDPTEKAGAPKKLNGKMWGIFGAAAVVLITVIAGISIYNMPANRLTRLQDLGNRYLEEQNYEQALLEFDEAIRIDPKSVDAYLGKALAYEGMDDLEKALETLQTGYEKTGDEQILKQLVNKYLKLASGYVQSADYESALVIYDKLLNLDGRNEKIQEAVISCLESYIEQLITEGCYDEAEALIEKYKDKVQGIDFQMYFDELKTMAELDELLAIIPSFDIEDIKVMGYDLLEPRMQEITKALGYSEIPHSFEERELQDGVGESVRDNGIFLFENGTAWYYMEYDWGSTLQINKVKGKETNAYKIGISRSDMPLVLGDSYEKWCDLIGVDLLRESPLAMEEESETLYTNLTDTNCKVRSYTISVGNTYISCGEFIYETNVSASDFYDFNMSVYFSMSVEGANVDSFHISADLLDGTLQSITYDFTW